MFILRRISSKGVQMNQIVGSGYTYIDKFRNPEEFEIAISAVFEDNNQANSKLKINDAGQRCYGFVCNGHLSQPLFENQKNLMMTSDGVIFEDLSTKFPIKNEFDN